MAGNAELARRLHEAWNERAFDEMAEATAADAKITIVGSGTTYEGPDGGRAYNEMWADGFPDGKVTVDRVIDGGDYVVVEFTGRGMLARCLQHETDHTRGTVFGDRLSTKQRKRLQKAMERAAGDYPLDWPAA